MAINFDYNYVISPTGQLDNHILREMFGDVKDYLINDLEGDLVGDGTTGATAELDNLENVAINTSLLSDTDNTDDLGNSTHNWRSIYFSTSLKSGATTLATATEVGYLSGVTSAIQTQLGNKLESVVAGNVNAEASTDGYVLTSDGAGNAAWETAVGVGATLALDNLASVAVNTSLISDTANTDDLGSALIAWRSLVLGTSLVFTSNNGTNNYAVSYPAATSGNFNFPATYGSNADVLTTDGSGNTGWSTLSYANPALSNLASVAINTSLLPDADGTLNLGFNTGAWGVGYINQIVMDGSTSGYVALKVPATITSYDLQLPSAIGASGTRLNSNGDGTTSWALPVINAGTFDAEVSTDGYILTSDGAGNAAWESPAANTGATFALDNLVSVAINTSLISDTDKTDDLGSAAVAWKDGYINKILMDGGTSGTVTVQPAAEAGTWSLTLPTTDGDADQVLTTNGSGVTTWEDAASGGTVYREDYVVGTALDNYSGSTTVFDLVGTYTTGDDSMTVFVDGVLQTIGAGNDYLETDTDTITFNNALVATQKVAFYFSVPTSSTDYATKALDNLGSVAINTSLISDTDSTDDLGSSAKKWANLYVDDIKGTTTKSEQPCFLLQIGTTVTNVTGDSTDYDVIYDTAVFDVGGDVADLGAGTYSTFTAPVTGKYQLNMLLKLAGIDAANHTTIEATIRTSNRIYVFYVYRAAKDLLTSQPTNISILADMDANDTAYTRVFVTAGTKTVDVASPSFFSGSLIN